MSTRVVRKRRLPVSSERPGPKMCLRVGSQRALSASERYKPKTQSTLGVGAFRMERRDAGVSMVKGETWEWATRTTTRPTSRMFAFYERSPTGRLRRRR